jgi:nucleoid DNA-binding protein
MAKAKQAAKAKIVAKPKAWVATKAVKSTTATLDISKVTPAESPRTKSEIIRIISEANGIPKKQVSAVFSNLSEIIQKDLAKTEQFSVPGLAKIRVIQRAKVPARKGINPFTGKEQTFKAKPARKVVKVKPLKALKDMV